MKTILSVSFALFVFALGCQAASPIFKDFDGSQFGTNGNKIRIKDGAPETNIVLMVISPGSGEGVRGERVGETYIWTVLTNGNITAMQLIQITPSSFIIYTNGVFLSAIFHSGIGSWTNGVAGVGITNNPDGSIAASSSINAGLGFNGNARGLSNINSQALFWNTNAAGSGAINATNKFQFLSTNNNVVFTGYANINGSNANPFTITITNTAGAAAVKFVQFPVGTLMLSSPFTNVVYVTNQGVFSGNIEALSGTNATWTGF